MQMFKWRPIYTLLLALCLWAFIYWCGAAFAHEHGASNEVNACLKTLHNQEGDQCCDGTDALKAETRWDYSANGYVVEIEGKKYLVPKEKLVMGDKCGVGIGLLWFHKSFGVNGSMMPIIRCFQAGGGN
jgi:hypothetical protein